MQLWIPTHFRNRGGPRGDRDAGRQCSEPDAVGEADSDCRRSGLHQDQDRRRNQAQVDQKAALVSVLGCQIEQARTPSFFCRIMTSHKDVTLMTSHYFSKDFARHLLLNDVCRKDITNMKGTIMNWVEMKRPVLEQCLFWLVLSNY